MLTYLFCNKCYKKSGNRKREVATQILKIGLANFDVHWMILKPKNLKTKNLRT